MSADQLRVRDGGAASGAVSSKLKKKKTRAVYNVCWPAGVHESGAASGAVSSNVKKKNRAVYNFCWPAAGQWQRGS